MERFRSAAVPLALLLVGLVGCSADPKSPTDTGGNPPDPTATLTRVQNEIFTPSCAFNGCHAGPGPQQGLDLSSGRAFANIVNVAAKESAKKRIAPNDPANSYLVDKIRGAVGITGERMPDGGPYLSEAQIQLVVDWVRNGAPNN